MIELAVFDIAGTTVDEGGAVYAALADAVRAAGADPQPSDIERWMGAGKREAIRALLRPDDDAMPSESLVDVAFRDFRSRLDAAYHDVPPTPFPGVPEALAKLRADGVRVALSTGFDRAVTTGLLSSLHWDDQVLDAVVCIDDVPAGRPAPYLIFRAMERTGVQDVRAVVAVGDTPRDVRAGRNAGAALVVAVLTGHVERAALEAEHPTHVVPSAADVPELVQTAR